MKRSKFSKAQIAFVLKQAEHLVPGAGEPPGAAGAVRGCLRLLSRTEGLRGGSPTCGAGGIRALS